MASSRTTASNRMPTWSSSLRDEVYNRDTADRGTAEVIVAKHRNGPIGVTHLAFLDHYTSFANMARV